MTEKCSRLDSSSKKKKQNKTIQKSNNQTSKSITRDNKMISENSNIRSVFEPVIKQPSRKLELPEDLFRSLVDFVWAMSVERCRHQAI